MPGVWSVVTGAGRDDGSDDGSDDGADGGGPDGFDTSSAEATEMVVAATNAAKIIERMAFPP
jgi:hypothetical protein